MIRFRYELGAPLDPPGHDHAMEPGSLAVIEEWLEAVNARDGVTLQALSSERVQITGPRGAGEMDRSILSEWLLRSGFSATPLRWFCGTDGSVVVEHEGEWHDVSTGEAQDRLRNASRFVVRNGVVTEYQRHDDGLHAALESSGLTAADEVTTRGQLVAR
jgi:hypothetical protein